jgi:hypothetical protein
MAAALLASLSRAYVAYHDHVVDVYRVVSEVAADPEELFPRSLAGLQDALGRAMWLSLAGAPRRVLAGDVVVRRFVGGRES